MGLALGHTVVVIGGVVMLGGLLGILDPQGIKQADDADPFGTAPSTKEVWGHATAGLLLVLTGCWVVARSRRSGRDSVGRQKRTATRVGGSGASLDHQSNDEGT